MDGQALKQTVEALHEVICASQSVTEKHEPTPTEYFAVVASSISTGAGAERLPDLLRVLVAVIPQASKTILQSQFKPFAMTMLNISKVNADNDGVLYVSLSVLGAFLLRQDTSNGNWGSVHAMQSINALLAFVDDARPKIRKIAHDQLRALLQLHYKSRTTAVRSYVLDFCFEVFRACTRASYKRSLLLVMMLESTLPLMPEDKILKLLDMCFGLQKCGIPKLTVAVYRMVDAFYQGVTAAPSTVLALKAFEHLLQAKPESADMECNVYYATALASGVVTLHRLDRAKCLSVVLQTVQYMVHICDSEFTEVHTAVGVGLKRVLTTFLDSTMITSPAFSSASPDASLLKSVLATFEVLLQLKYQYSWLYILDCARSVCELFKRNRGNFDLLGGIVKKLAEVYQAVEMSVITLDPTVHIALSDTLGAALRCAGVVKFLDLVPLLPMETRDNLLTFRDWVLRILHSNIVDMPCKLADFQSSILPLAGVYSKAIAGARLGADALSIYRNRVLQLWSLFPDFCAFHAMDIVSAFAGMVKMLCAIFSDNRYVEIVPHVINGLMLLARGVCERSPATASARSAEFVALQTHSPVVVPALLKFIEEIEFGNKNFQTAVQSITAWVAISAPPLVSSVSKKLLQLVLLKSSGARGAGDDAASSVSTSAATEDAEASKWMAVILSIVPYHSENIVQLLFRTVRPLVNFDESLSLQKRAYGVLHALLTSHSALIYEKMESRMSLLHAISESLLSCHVSARASRFKCLAIMLEDLHDPSELKQVSGMILGEVLICQKDANKKSRDGALAILKIFVQRLEPVALMLSLSAALVAETALMRSSAVAGLCRLLVQHRSKDTIIQYAGQLFPSVCLLLQEQSAEQTKAVLSYIKVCVAIFPVPQLEAGLPSIIPAFTVQLGAQKKSFATRCKSIMRKLVGRVKEDMVREALGESDDVALLDYVCRQARRTERNKSRKQTPDYEKLMDSDSEAESDDSDGEDKEEDASGAGKMGGIVVGGQGVEATDREDYRLGSRPKATRAVDALKLSASQMPTTLDDLLEDQSGLIHISTARRAAGAGAGASRAKAGSRDRTYGIDAGAENAVPDDEDEAYKVIVTSDGKVVVHEREAASSSKPSGSNKRTLDSDAPVAAPTTNTLKMDSVSIKKRKFNLKEPGEEYRSKKAGGDVWKRGMLEPHAYIPLDARLLNKKNHQVAVNHFQSVVEHKNARGAKAPSQRVKVKHNRGKR